MAFIDDLQKSADYFISGLKEYQVSNFMEMANNRAKEIAIEKNRIGQFTRDQILKQEQDANSMLMALSQAGANNAQLELAQRTLMPKTYTNALAYLNDALLNGDSDMVDKATKALEKLGKITNDIQYQDLEIKRDQIKQAREDAKAKAERDANNRAIDLGYKSRAEDREIKNRELSRWEKKVSAGERISGNDETGVLSYLTGDVKRPTNTAVEKIINSKSKYTDAMESYKAIINILEKDVYKNWTIGQIFTDSKAAEDKDALTTHMQNIAAFVKGDEWVKAGANWSGNEEKMVWALVTGGELDPTKLTNTFKGALTGSGRMVTAFKNALTHMAKNYRHLLANNNMADTSIWAQPNNPLFINKDAKAIDKLKAEFGAKSTISDTKTTFGSLLSKAKDSIASLFGSTEDNNDNKPENKPKFNNTAQANLKDVNIKYDNKASKSLRLPANTNIAKYIKPSPQR